MGFGRPAHDFEGNLSRDELIMDETNLALALEENRRDDEAAGLPVFRPIKASDFAKQFGPMQWHVKDLVPVSSFGAIIGPSGAGKSFFMAELVSNIASGNSFAGLRTRQGRVAVVLGEGAAGFSLRLQALTEKGIELSDDLLVVTGSTNLIDSIFESQLAKELIGCDLIVIDTLAACGGVFDENSAQDMGQLLANLKHLGLMTGATVLMIHHTGKDASRGARGSSALKAALDFEVTITGDTTRTAEVTKARDFETGKQITFEIEKVSLGQNADGEEVFSGVVRFLDGKQATKVKRAEPVGKWQRAVMGAARRILWQHPGSVGVEELVSEAATGLPADPTAKRDRRREYAARAAQDLVSTGLLIMVADDRVRLPNESADLHRLPQIPQIAANRAFEAPQNPADISANAAAPYKGARLAANAADERNAEVVI